MRINEEFKNDATQKQMRITVCSDNTIYIQNSEFTELEFIGLLTTLVTKYLNKQHLNNFETQSFEKEMD